MVIAGKVKDAIVKWIAKVLLLFFLKGQADHSAREYAFFQNIDCTRPLEGIGKELVRVWLRWSTTDETGYFMREEDNAKFLLVSSSG